MSSNTTLKGYTRIPEDYTGDIWIEGQIATLEAELQRLRQALGQPANWQEIDCPCCGDMARAFPPAPKREWVGLTTEQKIDIWEEYSRLTDSSIPTPEALFKVVEALLRDKNT